MSDSKTPVDEIVGLDELGERTVADGGWLLSQLRSGSLTHIQPKAPTF